MIKLGLARIKQLLSTTPLLPWRAIHVAGTNGKGSVCSYASAVLRACRVPCGQFTSPHLIDRWDCISIDGKAVDESIFREIQEELISLDKDMDIGASEFEILTATAFKAFTRHSVKIAVVEVGLGGRLDATNVLKAPLVTVITKVGLDHEAVLGKTIEAIAYEKAGIMKPGVPCLIDGSNPENVQRVFDKHATEVGAGPLTYILPGAEEYRTELWSTLERSAYEPHQQMHIALAFEAARRALRQSGLSLDHSRVLDAVKNTVWPGRLQPLKLGILTGRANDVLLDGAHNPQSAAVLGAYVDRRLRHASTPVTWVLGASRGKDLDQMLPLILRPGDNVAAVEFGPVEGQPWVHAIAAEDLLDRSGMAVPLGESRAMGRNVEGALRWATEASREGPMVVAGSLYLVSDVLRLTKTA